MHLQDLLRKAVILLKTQKKALEKVDPLMFTLC